MERIEIPAKFYLKDYQRDNIISQINSSGNIVFKRVKGKLTRIKCNNLIELAKEPVLVAFSSSGRKGKPREYRIKIDEANTLLCGDFCTAQSTKNFVFENHNGQLMIRYLLPVECERLMGWEDDLTLHGKNKKIADTYRYALCGNGVTPVCVEPIKDLILKMEGIIS